MNGVLIHYQTTNLDSSELKEFADDNFKFDKNCRKLSKRVENTVGKGEIARYEQFLLFLQCFQQACFPGASKGVIVWQCVKACQLLKCFAQGQPSPRPRGSSEVGTWALLVMSRTLYH